MKYQLLFAQAFLVASLCFGQHNTEAIEKIKNEGFNNSHVEKIAFELIDKVGPRLTNSLGFENASNYAIKQLSSWGLVNANKEAWGEFGRRWQVNKSYVAMTKPYYMPFIAVPKAWTDATNGEVKGKVVVVDMSSEDDFDKYKGHLKDAIVVVKSMFGGSQDPTFEPDAIRFTEEELKQMETTNGNNSNRRGITNELREKYRAFRALSKKIDSFLVNEGAVLKIIGTRGKHGTLFTSSPRTFLKDTPRGISEFEMAPEHVNLMSRLIENNVDVEVEAEIETTFNDDDLNGYNVIAEIPGTDKTLKNEIVMLGGHLDSWHGATGATDNAAGCIVMMEAVRILKATGLKLKRTIRIALWSGEEQGLFGSRNYVKNHFGNPETMELKDAQKKISAYYNIDNGTGRIRGIYLQGNEAVRPIFQEWFKPFDDIIDNTTLTIRNTGGTDHLSFDALSIPGFQFIQDPIEYRTRTHHTNMDTYDRLVFDDLKQMAVIVASFVYNTAQRYEKLPRKPLKTLD